MHKPTYIETPTILNTCSPHSRMESSLEHVEIAVSFDKHAKNMYQAFIKRGYQPALLDLALTKARSKTREQLLEKYRQIDNLNQAFLDTQQTQPPLPEQQNFYFTTKYHDGLHPIKKILRDNWSLLGKAPETEYLYESNLTLGYRRNTRLKGVPRPERKS